MKIIITLLLTMVSTVVFSDATDSDRQAVPDILSELKRLKAAEQHNSFKKIEYINQLPATSAGQTPTQGCQFSRNVLSGKELQFSELRKRFYTPTEYQKARTEVVKWTNRVKETCN